MENNIIKYLSDRMKNEIPVEKGSHIPGPVITISREVGCEGLKLARELARRLKEPKYPEWKVLSKEIFLDTAKELNLNPEQVRKFFKQYDRYTFEEVLNAFSYKHFYSERKIIKTLIEVVHTYAVEGFSIIVGRAGSIIAKDIKNSIHIKLIAPIGYRIDNVMANNPFTREEAINFIERIGYERIAFRKSVIKESDREELAEFDLIINRASFSTEAVVDIIIKAIHRKNILADYSKPVDTF